MKFCKDSLLKCNNSSDDCYWVGGMSLETNKILMFGQTTDVLTTSPGKGGHLDNFLTGLL